MSTGSGYNMILLSIEGPGGARVAPARTRDPRRPPHHASPPRKRHGQHHHRPSTSSRPTVRARQEETQELAASRAATVSTMAQRREDHTTTGGDAPRALSPPPGYFHMGWSPQGEHCRSAWTMPRRHSPGQYVQTPRHTWRDQWSSHATLEHNNRCPSCRISQVRGLHRLGPGRYTITSLRQRLLEEGRGCFYATEPDSGSESDSYDPTRECHHIDGAVETTDETQDAAAGGRAPAAREDPRKPGNDG